MRDRRPRCAAGCPKSPKMYRKFSSPGILAFGAKPLRRYIGPRKQPDSLLSPSRRTLLQAGLGATALLASPALAAAPPGFEQWRDGFRARALAKGISDAT